jgi:hypothetical protein
MQVVQPVTARNPRPVTYVTGFYDLSTREQGTSRKSADEYFSHGKFVLNIDAPMIIFTEPKYVKKIREIRSKQLYRTLIWIKDVESFRYWQRVNDVAACRSRNPIRNSDPRKDTPLYTILMWEKFQMLQLAIELDLFDSTHFAWIDFGIAHVASTSWTFDMGTWAPAKIKLAIMKWGSEAEVQDWSLRYGLVPGGFWIGPRDLMLQLNQIAFTTLDAGLVAGWAIMDEQLLGYMAFKYPTIFDHYYSDYGGMLDNFNEIHRDAYTLLGNVRHCTSRKDHAHAFDICVKLWQAYCTCHIKLNHHELSILLYEFFIVSYYTQAVEHARFLKKIYMEMTLIPEFNQLYLSNKATVDNNFSYVQ